MDDQTTTGGWASLLAATYSRRADVFNRGFSGYNTQWAVDRLLTRVFGDAANGGNSNSSGMMTGVAFCTVFFGANDAALPGQRQHVPIDRYQQNLVTIVKHIQSTLCSSILQQQQQQPLPIILLTPPPFDADAWMKHKGIDSPGRSNDVAREYGERVKLVAQQMNEEKNSDAIKCAVIDTWNLLHGSGSSSYDDKERCYSQYLNDGLHLNEAGNRIVYVAIMDVLQREFPHVAPSPTVVVPPQGKNAKNEPVVGLPLEEPMWDELC
jgi:isoamyl acetate esterase